MKGVGDSHDSKEEISIEMIGSESEDEKPAKQRTLDAFFKSPPPKKLNNNTENSVKKDLQALKVTKKPIASLFSKPNVNGHNDSMEEFESEKSVDKVKKVKTVKAKSSKPPSKSIIKKQKTNQQEPEKKKEKCQEEAPLEEISYLDFLSENVENEKRDDQTVECKDGSNAENHEDVINDVSVSEDCDITEALSMLESSVEQSMELSKVDCDDDKVEAMQISSEEDEFPKTDAKTTEVQTVTNVDESKDKKEVTIGSKDECTTEEPKEDTELLAEPVMISSSSEEKMDSTAENDGAESEENEPEKKTKKKSKKKSEKKTRPLKDPLKDDNPDDDLDVLPSKPPKGCRSITNFFSGGPKKTTQAKSKAEEEEDDHSEVIVVAEVHPEPSPPKEDPKQPKIFGIFSKEKVVKSSTPKRSPKKKSKKTNGVATTSDLDLSITHIDTSIIEVKETPKPTRRRLLTEDDESKDEDYLREMERDEGRLGEQLRAIERGDYDDKPIDTVPSGKKMLGLEQAKTGKGKKESKADKKGATNRKSDKGLTPDEKSKNKESNVEEKDETTVEDTKTEEDNVQEEKQAAAEEKATAEIQEARQAAITASMAALDNIKVTEKKTAQATLNFGGKSMTLQKPAPKPAKKTTPAKSPATGKKRKKSCSEIIIESDDENEPIKSPKVPKKKGKKTDSNLTKSSPKAKKAAIKGRAKASAADKDDADSKEKTPPPKATRGRPKKAAVPSPNETETSPPMTPRKKRVITSVYKTTLLHPAEETKKKTPLKIRITRLSGKNQEEEKGAKPKAKKQLGLTKAQQLLNKAKAPKSKLSPGSTAAKTKSAKGKKSKQSAAEEAEVSPSAGLRRSSRSSSLTARQAISIGYENIKTPKSTTPQEPESDSESEVEVVAEAPAKVTKAPAKVTKTPKKAKTQAKKAAKSPTKAQRSPTKTPSKPKKPGKLASIFQSKFAKSKDARAISISDDDAEAEPKVELTAEEKENQRIRREFLLSGVPTALKKQISTTEASAVTGDYAPVPTDSHVVQDQSDTFTDCPFNPWRLSSDPLSCRRLRPDTWWTDRGTSPTATLGLGHLTCCKRVNKTLTMPESRVPAPPLPEDTVRHLLSEVASQNSVFPVRRVYRQLCGLRKDAEGEPSSGGTQAAETVPKEETPSEANFAAVGKKSKMEDRSKRLRTKRRRASSDDVVVLDGTPKEAAKETPNSVKDATNDSQTGADKQDGGTVSLQWTDKYAPRSSADILGNTTAIKKLRAWLVEWKHRTDLEMRKLRKEQLKQAKKSGKTKEEIQKALGSDWWMSDDSDFDLSDEDSSSEGEGEDAMCNTTVITGPHGVGKTAAVYALAQELGYKVFEVNASSRRSGKHILAQLQEATQSHQVAKASMDDVYNSMLAQGKAPKIEESKPKPKPEKKLPTAFTNFFKKADTGSSDKAKTEEKEKKEKKEGKDQKSGGRAKRGRPRKESECGEEKPAKRPKRKSKEGVALVPEASQSCSQAPRKGLNLSSVSLVLFDEVDLVFEEDKGFWAAVQTFMSTTKRPIILTSRDRRFLDSFRGRTESIVLKTPSMTNVTSYLQLVCLCEGLRTSSQDLHAVTTLYRSDLRRLLLTLQWWAESGASVQSEPAPISYKRSCLKEKAEERSVHSTPTKMRLLALQTDAQSADEFELQKPKKRARRCVIEDEDSRDGFPSPVKMTVVAGDNADLSFLQDDASSQGFPGMWGEETRDADLVTVAMEDNTPQIQGRLLASVTMATGCIQDSRNLLQPLTGATDMSAAQEICRCFTEQSIDLVYNNLRHLVPLTRVRAVPRPPPPVPNVTDSPLKPSRRRVRILNTDDLYDSEASNDDFITLSQRAKQEDNSNSKPAPRPENDLSKEANAIIQSSLDSLSRCYDDLSMSDAYFTLPCSDSLLSLRRFEFDRAQGRLLPGLADAPRLASDYRPERPLCEDLSAAVSARSYARLHAALQDTQTALAALDHTQRAPTEDRLRVPVEETTDRVRVTPDTARQTSVAQCVCRATDNVARLLPVTTSQQRVSLNTDYLPMIRGVCKMEQIRAATQNKRRFFHYMEPIVSGVKRTTLNSLCTSFY